MQSKNTPRKRVFVSSVVDGFEAFREAARRGIKAAGCEPVLINEDMPSAPTSSRNVCLDGVASCDIYVAVIGRRGGWTAPSGKLVIEEEFEEARRQSLPVLVFLQQTDRDADGARLARRLSDYVEGYFRVEIDSPQDLEREVERALTRLTEETRPPSMDLPIIQDLLARAEPISSQHPNLRFVLAPQRREEVISPVRIESKDFRFMVYHHAHRLGIELLSYEHPKTYEITSDALVIREAENNRHRTGQNTAQLEIKESGCVVIDLSLIPSSGEARSFGAAAGKTLTTDDLKMALGRALQLCEALYDEIDRSGRYQQFAYNVAIVNLGMHQIATNTATSRGATRYRQHNDPIHAYDAPRPLARNGLRAADDEIRRAVVRIRRRSEQPPETGPGLNF